uniref:Transposable element Tc1 transposase n=1 Tax=Zeugodacus cucurbitae TaxID=28588 RepID=A0A0A1WE64_ZEUCU
MMAEMRKKKTITPKNTLVAKNKHVSKWTARRALHNIGYISAVKKNKPALSKKDQKARMKFARERKNWTINDWQRVIWSDESKFNLFCSKNTTLKFFCCFTTLCSAFAAV